MLFCSTIFSSVGSHRATRWMFCNRKLSALFGLLYHLGNHFFPLNFAVAPQRAGAARHGTTQTGVTWLTQAVSLPLGGCVCPMKTLLQGGFGWLPTLLTSTLCFLSHTLWPLSSSLGAGQWSLVHTKALSVLIIHLPRALPMMVQ